MVNDSIVTSQAMHRWTLFHLCSLVGISQTLKITLRVAVRFYKNADLAFPV